MANPDAAEVSGCAVPNAPAIGSTTVIVPGFALALLGTATYSFFWLGSQVRSLPSRSSTVRLVAGSLMLKVRLPDKPPPGVGFCTVTLAVPTALRSDAGICALSDVLDP